MKIMENVAYVALDENSTAAITNIGDLYMWGNNEFGQLGNGSTVASSKPVFIMGNVSTVSLSSLTSAAITTDGSLYLWGENFHGQLGNGLYGGNEYFNGYDNGIDSNVPVKIMDNVSQVSLSDGHSAAITKDGILYIWGWNMWGQLGIGTHGGSHYEFTEGSDSCVPIKLLDNVISVSLGASVSGAVTKDNTLYTWGSNNYGGLGIGADGVRSNFNGFDEEFDRDVPTKVMDGVISVSYGTPHGAAITSDGSLYLWGENYNGELGDGYRKDSPTPVKIMDNVISANLASDTSSAVKADGTLWFWGTNGTGQLGNGTLTNSKVPVRVIIPEEHVIQDNPESGKKVKQVLANKLGYNCLAITEDDVLYSWGHSLVYFSNVDSTRTRLLDNVSTALINDDNCAALTKDGDLYMWRDNNCGQLGTGDTKGSNTPIKVMSDVVYVTIESLASAAITSDGSLYMWWSIYNSSENICCTPTKVMDNVIAVDTGIGIYAAITEDGTLYGWGKINAGNQNSGSSSSDVINPTKLMDNTSSVIVSGDEMSAITTDGKLYSFNYADGPELMLENVIYADVVGSENGYFGANYVALTADGDLYTWGDCKHGQLGNGNTENKVSFNSDAELIKYGVYPGKIMENVVQVSFGPYHSAAITADGSLYTWGDNMYGQLGNGIYGGRYDGGFGFYDYYFDFGIDSALPIKVMDNVSSVSVGITYTAAITKDGKLYTWGDNEYGQLGNEKGGGDSFAFDMGIDSAVPMRIVIPDCIEGDSNNDGKVNLEDAILTLRYAMNINIGDSTFVFEEAMSLEVIKKSLLRTP